jgi:short subunit dehydrogenase-like uncharacterized protein
MTSDPLLIYGATGYTGRLVVDAALARGLRPILGGRNAARVEALAAEHGLEHRAAPLTDPAALERLLRNVSVVLLAAGPFSETAAPVVDACLGAGIHYLDLTGECAVIEALSCRGADARRRNCMVMPACGFEVVASDCLASHVSRRLPGAASLAIGISGLVTATRGSLRTIAEQAGMAVRMRRNGELVSVAPAAHRRRFDYGRGDGWSSAVTWGDLASAFRTTGIPDIEVCFEDTPTSRAMLLAGRTFGPWLQLPIAQAWLKAHVPLFPEGPTAAERAIHRCVIVAEATMRSGRQVTSRLRTPEAYSLSAQTAAAIAGRALRGDVEPGFQTPARVYGADFILGFEGVIREDLDRAGPSPEERLHASVMTGPSR